jgi:hypothetical protein
MYQHFEMHLFTKKIVEHNKVTFIWTAFFYPLYTANAPKANALNRGVHSNSHSVAILHVQVFIFILWEKAQHFESFDINKSFLAAKIVK